MALTQERRGRVLVVTLNRPDVLNALDDKTFDDLLTLWSSVGDSGAEAVVLTGAGRAFCAGADLRAPIRSPADIARNQRTRFNALVLAMTALPLPIVAAVNGHAVGAGLSLACAADVRIASQQARFKAAFAQIGAVPDAGATWTVPRLIGPGRAFDWFCSGRTLDADQALAWGLVNEVVPADALLDRAVARGEELADVPGVAVALTKRLMGPEASFDLREQLEREAEAQEVAASDPARVEARARATRSAGAGEPGS